ncbi:MFS transporter [Helicobacter cappadocius]|uniref:MFS transporter n=1 Tax=Helicobacter cappadocius TaxID=3063998 RepID=A0AA90T5G0_9HELI|nr:MULTISPECIES: MFS transporter [unclassified Helicobacter]MDO7253451.1 MFS transporter [Helicobacter sp. faydin-H75]MDP2539378.1 MFS transporter [Helicobacter sp. faydin-H76]
MKTTSSPRLLNRNDVKTLSLSSLGGTLEFYDFIIFVFFAQTIAHLFYPETLDPLWSALNTYGTFAAGYFARPLGGIVMAHFGDKNGRKNMFMLSILLMVIPTFLMGILPTYESIGYFAPVILLLIRIFQGIAIGGELPGAWVFVCEHTPKNRLGFSIGVLTSCVVGGILLGSIVAFFINAIFDTAQIMQYAWRIPFLLGGVFGIISIFLRRYLQETPIFQEMKKSKSLAKIPIQEVFKTSKTSIITSMFSTWVLTGCIIVLVLLVPNFMSHKLQVPQTQIILIQMLTIFSLIIGCILSGSLADKIGVSRAYIVFSIAFSIVALIFFYALYGDYSNRVIFIWYVIAGFFGGVMNFTPLTMVSIFPPNIRFSGLSFSYNLSYAIFGGLAPILVVSLNAYNSILVGYYLAFLGIIGVGVGIFLHFFKKYKQTL